MRKKSRTKDAVAIIDKLIGDDLRALVDEEVSNLEIAQLVYDARTRAGLTQQQLARLVGTTQPVIARLESADYRGHSLRMLRRIAVALGHDLEIRFVPHSARTPVGR
jgi:ribosome-binding protein aMBF1 (putative translation factor)